MNDLNRLLDDAVPEPRRALAAGDLVHRARRRRATRTAALGTVTAVALVAGIAVANGATGGPDRPPSAATLTPTPEPTASPTTSVRTTEAWWPEDTAARVRCAETYPTGLAAKPVAFAGTVTEFRVLPHVLGKVDVVEIDLSVERTYAGPVRSTVTLRTDPTMLPARGYDITGIRVLVAAQQSLEMLPCGFTRTYWPEDAAFWERVFKPTAYVCHVSSEGQPADRDAREYVGMSVEDAERLAESRGLRTRLIGDGTTGVRDDLRTDRVNLCNRDGEVVAAAIF